MTDTLLEHKKNLIAKELENLRRATAKIHLNKNFPQKEQSDESADSPFPTQDAKQKRGGNKLRKRDVADCLKAYCEPNGKAQLGSKTGNMVKKSANGFSHQFVNSKVNNDLMDSIRNDLSSSRKYFYSKSEENDSKTYSNYFGNTNKLSKPKPLTTYNTSIMKQPESSDSKADSEYEEDDYYYDENPQEDKDQNNDSNCDTKL